MRVRLFAILCFLFASLVSRALHASQGMERDVPAEWASSVAVGARTQCPPIRGSATRSRTPTPTPGHHESTSDQSSKFGSGVGGSWTCGVDGEDGDSGCLTASQGSHTSASDRSEEVSFPSVSCTRGFPSSRDAIGSSCFLPVRHHPRTRDECNNAAAGRDAIPQNNCRTRFLFCARLWRVKSPGNNQILRVLQIPTRRPPVAREPLPDDVQLHKPEVPFSLEQDRLLRNLRVSRRGGAAGLSGRPSTLFWSPSTILSCCIGFANFLPEPPQWRCQGHRGRRSFEKTRRPHHQPDHPFNRSRHGTLPVCTTRAGTDCILHVLQSMTDMGPLATVLSVDGVGAFDLVSRSSLWC